MQASHPLSVLASLARDAESYERASACSSLDHRYTPGKGQSTAGSQTRSKHLDLPSQQASTAGGEVVIYGNPGALGKGKGNEYWMPRK